MPVVSFDYIAQHEAMAEEITRLRAALEPFAKAADRYDPDENDGFQEAWDWTPTIGMLRRARAALAQGGDK